MLKVKMLIFIAFFSIFGFGQVQNKKVINEQAQSWISLNNTITFNKNWGVLADFHLRRNDFVNTDSFYLVRGAAAYITESKQVLALGYGHMWIAPSNPYYHNFTNENLTYQLFQFNSRIGSVSVLHRFRNEQRWQQVMVNDNWSGDNRFSDRLRYLISFDIPIFKKKTLPRLSISNEILIQFGKEVVYNTFDQNRFFIGIKQSISPKLSFDFGYMNVYQEKKSGYQYDMNHTLRLFFYYKLECQN